MEDLRRAWMARGARLNDGLRLLAKHFFGELNILGLCLIFGKLSFTMVLYEKNFEMLRIIWCNIIKCFVEFKLLFKSLRQKYIIFRVSDPH